jgi:4-amino-4-deoxy-L-arabinose transferase-like glycosyltransferase
MVGPHGDPTFIRTLLAGRLTSMLASTLTVLVVYRLGSEVYGHGAGLIAALIVAFSGLLIELAHFATPDSTTVLWVSSNLLASYLAMQRPRAWRFAVAGVLVGLAVGTEYHMGLLLVPVCAAWLLSGTRQRRFLLLAAACAAGVYLMTNAYALIDFQGFVAAIVHTIKIRTVDSQAEYQGRWAEYGPALLYVIRYPLGYGEGFAFAAWLVAGAGWAMARRRKSDMLLLSWTLPYFILVTLSTAKFMRYSAPLLPPLAVLAGSMTRDLWSLRQRAIRVAVPLTAAIAVGAAVVYDAAYAGLFTSPDPRTVATVWLEQRVPAGTKVAFEQLPNGLVNVPYFVAAAGYEPCFAQFKTRRLAGPVKFVVVDNYGLEEHPRVSKSKVQRFRKALLGSSFTVAEKVHYIPTFLGFHFPIDGSPNDWRYPDHVITIYHHVIPSGTYNAQCYPNVQVAAAALHPLSEAR